MEKITSNPSFHSFQRTQQQLARSPLPLKSALAPISNLQGGSTDKTFICEVKPDENGKLTEDTLWEAKQLGSRHILPFSVLIHTLHLKSSLSIIVTFITCL